MTLDFSKHARLFGTHAASKVYDRGGTLAEGPLWVMITKAVGHMETGCLNVRIEMVDDSSAKDSAAIREIADSADFLRFRSKALSLR